MNKKVIIAAMLTSTLTLAGCNLISSDMGTTTTSSANAAVSTSKPDTKDPKAEMEAKVKEYEVKIYPGVTIEGIDVSGLTESEADKKLQDELMSKVIEKKITYSVLGMDDYTSYNKMGVKLNPETIKDALAYDDNMSLEEKFKQITNPVKKDFKAKLSYNQEHFNFVSEEITNLANSKNPYKNARIVDGKVVTDGNAKAYKVDIEDFIAKMKERINADLAAPEKFEVKLTEVDSTIQDEKLASITDVISEYSTDYSYSIPERKNNIKLSADKLNNTLVMPGQNFSLYNIVGDITKELGYQASMVYVNNNMIPEVGGGVCQLSTTLYNAVIYAGMVPTSRSNHSMVVSYVPYGMDAAIYFPGLDFRFTNTLDHPILIETIADGSTLTVRFWGNPADLKGVQYKFRQEVYDKLVAPTTKVEDPTLPAGETKIVVHAFDGYKVKVYRQKWVDGNMVSEELFTDDTYNKVDGVIKIGIKR